MFPLCLFGDVEEERRIQRRAFLTQPHASGELEPAGKPALSSVGQELPFRRNLERVSRNQGRFQCN